MVAKTRRTDTAKTPIGTSNPMKRLTGPEPMMKVMAAAMSGPMKTSGNAQVERNARSGIMRDLPHHHATTDPVAELFAVRANKLSR